MGAAAESGDVAEIITEHARSLSRITSYHVTVTAFVRLSDGVGKFSRAQRVEVWQTPSGRREHNRAYVVLTADGEATVVNSNGAVDESSYDAQEVRTLNGWDSEHPFRLPLEFGRNSGEFSSVRGTIEARDVTRKIRGVEHIAMLLCPVPQWTLSELEQHCQFVDLPIASEGKRRLRIESATSPEVRDHVGTVLELDPRHGWMVSKIERPGGYEFDVDEFKNISSDLWLPARAHLTIDGQPSVKWEIDFHSVNQPLSDELLRVQFPPGCRVDERVGNQIHIWGDGAPLQTFTNHAAFEEAVYKRAREYQSQNTPKVDPAKSARPETTLILIVNCVLIALVVLLTILRRRLNRAGGPPSGAS
jgi:hypothetical protein